MSELKRDQSDDAQSESGRSGKVPLTARPLMRESFTARRAGAVIAAFTLLITLGGGTTERLLDRQEFPTIGKGLWFALQTVTTVGYGDIVPRHAAGRIIASVVMVTRIGFITIITASVTAGLIQSSRRHAGVSERDSVRTVEDVRERLVRIEAAIDRQQSKA